VFPQDHIEEGVWEVDVTIDPGTGEIVSATPQPVVTARQAGTISAARTKNKWEPELFSRLLGEFGVDEVISLPAARYDEFMQILRAGGGAQEPLL
jgi:hypothetical protein